MDQNSPFDLYPEEEKEEVKEANECNSDEDSDSSKFIWSPTKIILGVIAGVMIGGAMKMTVCHFSQNYLGKSIDIKSVSTTSTSTATRPTSTVSSTASTTSYSYTGISNTITSSPTYLSSESQSSRSTLSQFQNDHRSTATATSFLQSHQKFKDVSHERIARRENHTGKISKLRFNPAKSSPGYGRQLLANIFCFSRRKNSKKKNFK